MRNKKFKSGFVSIIGRPNVGKSTLLNNILETKVAIVTPKAQTTRNKIQGIYTTENEQIIFIDTPGIHKAFNNLGENMNQAAYDSLDGIDAVLLLVDVTKEFSELDQEIVDRFKKIKEPIFLVLNKIDLVKDDQKVDELIEKYNSIQFKGVYKISALNNNGVSELLTGIVDVLEEGPQYYPSDQLMDQPERFMVKEIIREKVLFLTSQEIPYAVAVEVESFKNDLQNPNLININATIIVERQSQKKIIIGEKGSKIKEIGRLSRIDIAKFLGNKVYLELFVKVEADWRNRKHYLIQFGYENKKV